MTPYIYEGLLAIYSRACEIADESKKSNKILSIFQKLLQSIDEWNQSRIDDETNRIKMTGQTQDYLDDLVKAVIRSNIILLSCNNNISQAICQNFYNGLSTSALIHRCYAECGKDAHNNPYLFFHGVEPLDYKRNQVIIQDHVRMGITRAIRKILPISMILKEYLVNSMNLFPDPNRTNPLFPTQSINNAINNPFQLPSPMQIPGQPTQIVQPTQPIQSMQQFQPLPIEQPMGSQMMTFGTNITAPETKNQIEHEIFNVIKSENVGQNPQKIKAIMNIEKIITSVEPNQMADFVPKTTSARDPMNLPQANPIGFQNNLFNQQKKLYPHTQHNQYNQIGSQGQNRDGQNRDYRQNNSNNSNHSNHSNHVDRSDRTNQSTYTNQTNFTNQSNQSNRSGYSNNKNYYNSKSRTGDYSETNKNSKQGHFDQSQNYSKDTESMFITPANGQNKLGTGGNIDLEKIDFNNINLIEDYGVKHSHE
ncbi:hypothetical protein QJ850_gp549 [Acanthamoeba polyphaga mimivirus]|uniref:Uncharacterized protein n=1 Tax=Acanthamoeba polyphaga mimivirus Kroon TaxID=3069720 RepID=A0A0G2Y310_9VIRU|nr:hypothetical protein QJ850_gp549 [Acanthamoeba polyphaga mimivirus]AKI80150.1 hypothetical protein [Acanthamoeba polyphaga mimivirus Kroon]